MAGEVRSPRLVGCSSLARSDPVEFEAVAGRPLEMAVESGPGPVFAHLSEHTEQL